MIREALKKTGQLPIPVNIYCHPVIDVSMFDNIFQPKQSICFRPHDIRSFLMIAIYLDVNVPQCVTYHSSKLNFDTKAFLNYYYYYFFFLHREIIQSVKRKNRNPSKWIRLKKVSSFLLSLRVCHDVK